MDKADIEYRRLRQADFPVILKMVIDTWHYRAWVPAKLVEPLAAYFMYDMLERSPEIYVAELAGNVVGVIAFSTDIQTTLRQTISHHRIRAISTMLQAQDSDSIVTKFVETMEMDEKLLKNQHKKYDGTINLLLVAKSCKGLGIGKKLYQRFISEMQHNGLTSFYLFTDSSSNYHFYEHFGVQKVAQAVYDWQNGDDSIELYYLYEGKVALDHN